MLIFDGKAHSANIDGYIKTHVQKLKQAGTLLIVLIGDNPASLKYIGVKTKLCQAVGINVDFLHLSADLSDQQIFKKVQAAFSAPHISGGIVQFPLPRTSLQKILSLIPADKDIEKYPSPVVRAAAYFLLTALNKNFLQADCIELPKVEELLAIELKNKKVCVIGDGFLVGRPIKQYLSRFVKNVHTNQMYRKGDKIYSDFLILGAGVPSLVNTKDISAGCHVLDFGTSVLDGKVVGDLDRNDNFDHLGLVSFSPGGIGPVVVRFLVLNFLRL